MVQERMQVLISAGPEDLKRAVLGFSVAAAAVSAGTQVTLFLVMEGARWAMTSEGNTADVPGFRSISELIDAIQMGGGTIEVCSTCAAEESGCTRVPDQLRPGITPGGLVKIAIRMSEIPTVTF